MNKLILFIHIGIPLGFIACDNTKDEINMEIPKRVIRES